MRPLSTISSTPLVLFQHPIPLLSLGTLEMQPDYLLWKSTAGNGYQISPPTPRTVVEQVLYADAPSCYHLGPDWSFGSSFDWILLLEQPPPS